MHKILGFNSQNPKQKQKQQEKNKTTETKQISVIHASNKEGNHFPDVQKDTQISMQCRTDKRRMDVKIP